MAVAHKRNYSLADAALVYGEIITLGDVMIDGSCCGDT